MYNYNCIYIYIYILLYYDLYHVYTYYVRLCYSIAGAAMRWNNATWKVCLQAIVSQDRGRILHTRNHKHASPSWNATESLLDKFSKHPLDKRQQCNCKHHWQMKFRWNTSLKVHWNMPLTIRDDFWGVDLWRAVVWPYRNSSSSSSNYNHSYNHNHNNDNNHYTYYVVNDTYYYINLTYVYIYIYIHTYYIQTYIYIYI